MVSFSIQARNTLYPSTFSGLMYLCFLRRCKLVVVLSLPGHPQKTRSTRPTQCVACTVFTCRASKVHYSDSWR